MGTGRVPGPFLEANALTFNRLAREYGVLPHQLLTLDYTDFDFDLTVTMLADRKIQDELDEQKKNNPQPGVEKNKFAETKNSKQLTQNEFEGIFRKAFVKEDQK